MIRRTLRLVTVMILVAFTTLVVTPARSVADTPVGQSQYVPVVVVMDTSDSMDEASGPDQTRIEGARAAVIDLVDSLGPQTPFGLIAYPGVNARTVDGCSEGNLLVRISNLDQSATAAAVRKLTTSGDTPTGPALLHAGRLIKNDPLGKGTIVLVSDGESNCGTSPCEVAKKLSTDGVEVRVNTVGLQISEQGAQELQCISNVTGGRYVDAENGQDLREALQDLGGARITLDGGVPPKIAAVSGTGTSGPQAVFTVSNSGRMDALDVRVSLDFRDKDNRPGAVLVPRPIRFLGNIAPGQSRNVQFVIRPDAARLEHFSWTATATASNTVPALETGESDVVEPFGQVTGLLAGKDNIVVMGDSYSSGTGTGNYQQGTNSGPEANECRRSPDSYGPRLFNATIIACHGAITANFFTWQHSGSKWLPPQLQILREMVDSGKSPRAVLMTIGGNDAMFANLVTNCSIYPDCGNYSDESITELVAPLAESLYLTYSSVNAAVNEPKARGAAPYAPVDARGGIAAPIVVLPYPRLLPSEKSELNRDGCSFGISRDEIGYLNRFTAALNTTIKSVVVKLSGEGVPVYYAADVENAFQPNHTICDTAGFVNAATKGNALDALKPENIHPNKEGWAAMARAVSAWSSTQATTENQSETNWKPFSLLIRDNRPRIQPAPPRGLATVGGEARFSGTGFGPNSPLVLRIESTPSVVASAAADANGSIAAVIPIPANVRPGYHHIVAVGFGPDGQLHRQAQAVWVWPRYSFATVILLGLGVIATVVGLRGIRGTRKFLQSADDRHGRV